MEKIQEKIIKALWNSGEFTMMECAAVAASIEFTAINKNENFTIENGTIITTILNDWIN